MATKDKSTTQPAKATILQAVLGVLKDLTSEDVLKQVFPDFMDKFKTVNDTVYRNEFIQVGMKGDVNDKKAFVYITLRRFCELVNCVLLVDQNNKPIVKINTKSTPSSKFRTFDYHTSADPGVCLLPNTNGWPINDTAKTSAVANSVGGVDEILNIHVNIDFLEDQLRGLVNSQKSQRTVYNLFEPIFTGLNEAMGNINAFSFHYDESKQTFYIVDRQTQVEKGEVIPVLDVTGLQSTVTKFDFTTKLSPAITTMVAVSAQASGQDVGIEAEALLRWNQNLTDRVMTKRRQNITTQGSTESEKEATKQRRDKISKGRIKGITKALNAVWATKVYNREDIKNAVVQYQAYAADYIQSSKDTGNTAGPAGIIPFEVSLEMDGISGIKIGQAFQINQGIMPNKYHGVVGFIVTGIEHNISNNRWTTRLKAQTIILDGIAGKDLPVDPTSVGTGVTPKEEEQQGLEPVPANYESVTDAQLFTYLSWQQGLEGAAQHYSLWKQNGRRKRYTIKIENIRNNWPGNRVSKNGVKKSQIRKYYTNDQPGLAAGFVDVWRQQYYEKLTQGLNLLNGKGKNRSGVPYSTIKQAFETHAKPSQGLTFNSLAAFGFIENAYQTDTRTRATFQSMFQMNKTYTNFSKILNATKAGEGHKEGWVEYGPPDKFVSAAVPAIIGNYNDFKKISGFVA